MQTILERLRSQAEARFRAEGTAIGLTRDELDRYVNEIALPQHRGGEELFLGIFSVALIKKLLNDANQFQGVARSFQALANHVVYQNGDRLESEMRCILEDLRGDGSSIQNDSETLLKLLADAHNEVDAFFSEYTSSHAASQEEMMKLNSVSHHALDWIMQADLISACKRSPQKLAATAIGVMLDVNGQIENDIAISKKELARFGGWSGSGAMQSTIIRSAFHVLNEVRDPSLLVPNPEVLPEGWEDRLYELAGLNEEEDEPTGSSEDFHFDNCPICRAQRDALLSGEALAESKLREAFRRAEEKGDGITI